MKKLQSIIMNIEERICRCLDENGIFVEKGKISEIEDSFVLVSTMVSLEEEFNIEIPEVFIGIELFSTVEHLNQVITELLVG